MSAAAAPAAADAAAAPPAKGKKKLIIIIAAALLVVAAGGGGAVFYMKKKAAEAAAAAEAEGEDGASPKHKKDAKHDASHPPAFLPLDPFIVNLADKEVDRYAQIGVTLELDDAKTADTLKAYMPAIRNGILMVLAHKTSAELLERKGKEALANEIMREVVKPLGVEMDDPEADAEDDNADAKPKKKKKKKAEVELPVKHVHFSNFIIQ